MVRWALIREMESSDAHKAMRSSELLQSATLYYPIDPSWTSTDHVEMEMGYNLACTRSLLIKMRYPFWSSPRSKARLFSYRKTSAMREKSPLLENEYWESLFW